MRFLKRLLLFGCLPVLLLGAAGAFVSYRKASWTPAREERPAPPLPEAQEEAHEKIEEVTEEVEQAQERGETPTFELALDQEEANALITREPEARKALAGAGLLEPYVEFGDGKVTLRGFIDLAGREAFLSVTGAVALDAEGRLQAEIRDVRLGDLPAPPVVRRVVTEKVNQALRKANRGNGPRLDRLLITPEGLEVEGVAPPRRRRRGSAAPEPRAEPVDEFPRRGRGVDVHP